ncbi:MAG TPA: hypothetical protein GX707_01625 [Epulopiscium sp.]|nr:hypothetical protein [Candidatus Epulonipiscium sp.]
MSKFTKEFSEEFENIQNFIDEKYGVNIKRKEQLVDFVQTTLSFLMSLKIWKSKLASEFLSTVGIEKIFDEMISNVFHLIIMGAIDLKIPALVMIRRTQENILSFLYYCEHPVEYYRKEKDDSIRILSGFSDLKDYIKLYPYSIKYNLEDKRVQEISRILISDWGLQYKELSNYVHGTNSQYFELVTYLDELKFSKKNTRFIREQVLKLSSIVNSLLIIFYFETYIKFDEKNEKKIIRNSIDNRSHYKKQITDIFGEI